MGGILRRDIVVLLGMGVRGGVRAAGLLTGLDNLLSALYSYPGGYASERLGIRRALMLFNLLAMVGYLIVLLIPVWQAVILGAFLFISWTAISLPATMELVATVLPTNRRTMGVTMHSLVRRVPMALGPVLGGAAIGRFGPIDGVRLAFGAALALAGASLVLQRALITEGPRRAQPVPLRPLRSPGLLRPALRGLLFSDILVRFCEQIPYAFVVIWAVQLNGITPLQFGWLTAIEMATAVLIYIPVAYLGAA